MPQPLRGCVHSEVPRIVVPSDITATLAFVSLYAGTVSLLPKDTFPRMQSCGAGTVIESVPPPNSSALTSVSPEGDCGSDFNLPH